MTRFGVILVVLTAFPVLLSETHASQIEKRSRLVRELASPLRITGPLLPERNTPPRDIYLIVLDGHANSSVLKNVFDFDNSAFEDRLRALGFFVPRDMRSNYVQTYLSLASLLNASHLLQLTDDAGAASKDHSISTYLVQNNRVARFVKAHGYRYVLFPSAWWAATANSPLADTLYDTRRGFNINGAYRSELRLAILRSSPFRSSLLRDGGTSSIAQHFLSSFEGLRAIADDPTPTFTFAHILLPHVPYVVDERCRPLAQPIADSMEADTPEQRTAYINQVRCVDGLVLDLVTELLRRSATSPIILIVGDHGPRFTDDIGFYAHPERVSTAFIRERFGAFGAFHLPAGGDTMFREPVTLVNVLGHVLRYYFNADLAPSSDDLYVSGVELYRFYPVAADRYAP